MESKGRRFGFFCLAFLPALASMVMQVGIGVLIGIIAILQTIAGNPDASALTIQLAYSGAVLRMASLSILGYHLISIPVFGLWYYFGCGRPKMINSIKCVTAKTAVTAILCGILLVFFTQGLVQIEFLLSPKLLETYSRIVQNAGLGTNLWTNLAAIFIAPIGEELVCRGLTLHYGRKALPRFWMANVLQALLFAFMHGNFVQGSYAFLLGLILGWLVKKSGSLIPAILGHFAMNCFSMTLSEPIYSIIPEYLAVYVLISVVAAVLICLLLYWNRTKKTKTEEEVSNV